MILIASRFGLSGSVGAATGRHVFAKSTPAVPNRDPKGRWVASVRDERRPCLLTPSLLPDVGMRKQLVPPRPAAPCLLSYLACFGLRLVAHLAIWARFDHLESRWNELQRIRAAALECRKCPPPLIISVANCAGPDDLKACNRHE